MSTPPSDVHEGLVLADRVVTHLVDHEIDVEAASTYRRGRHIVISLAEPARYREAGKALDLDQFEVARGVSSVHGHWAGASVSVLGPEPTLTQP